MPRPAMNRKSFDNLVARRVSTNADFDQDDIDWLRAVVEAHTGLLCRIWSETNPRALCARVVLADGQEFEATVAEAVKRRQRRGIERYMEAYGRSGL